jgi:acyl-CoA synthetase (AMP-forming)/AMP-acid ligase II
MGDMTRPELVRRAGAWPSRTALEGADGTITYAGLLERSARAASVLLDGRTDLSEARVVFLLPDRKHHVDQIGVAIVQRVGAAGHAATYF